MKLAEIIENLIEWSEEEIASRDKQWMDYSRTRNSEDWAVRPVSITGTSHWGNSITASLNQLKRSLGNPVVTEPGDKTNIEYQFKNLDTNEIATLYDWKSSVNPAEEPDKKIIWHIGALNKSTSMKFQEWLEKKVK